jgi:arabinogalactan oligomer/maltooligosaccharide transport system permease protein
VILALAAAAWGGEVSLWHAYRGDERVALESLCARWTAEHPGTQVLPIYVPNEALASKVEAAVPHGNGPDLFVFGHDRIADWSALGVIQPVSGVSDVLPAARAALTWKSQTWGWPLAVKSVAVFYNRALIAEPPATTDALLALADRPLAPGTFRLVSEIGKAYHAAPWLHGAGGGVFVGEEVQLDQPANIAGFRLVQRIASEIVPPDPSGALVTQLFNEGRAAMAITGPWFLGEVNPALDYGVAPLPIVSETGRPAAPYLTVEAVFLARPGEEAAALGAWLAGPEGAAVRQRVGRQVVAAEGIQTDDPILAAFRAQAALAVPMPVRPELARTWEPLDRALKRLVRGATPEEAAAEAQAQYRVLSRPAPPPAAPGPWIVAAAIGAIAVAGVGGRAAWRAPIRKWWWAYAWVAPAFLAMLVLTVLPFAVGAAVSLFEVQESSWTFVGAGHFLDILLARDFPIGSPLSFWTTLVVTIAWTVANVALHVGIGVALALLLREPWIRLRGVFRAALILPWAIPSYITALVWKNLFHQQFGAINALLRLLGAEPVSWFGSFSTAFAANLCTNTWLGFPFMMVVTLGALQAIPRDLEEAAEVDGASAWQRFRHVTLPLLAPALLPAVILGSVWTFNMFNIIFLVSGGEPDGSTEILISQAYRWAFTRGHHYGYASAYAVIIFAVLVAYSRLTRRLA